VSIPGGELDEMGMLIKVLDIVMDNIDMESNCREFHLFLFVGIFSNYFILLFSCKE
jgi:hypothetical protein